MEKQRVRHEYFKVVSKHKEKVYWGPGSYEGAVSHIIYSDVQDDELIIDMVYMRPADATKQRKELEERLKEE
jgi:uncharacterized protein YeeX (DUF496 family)